MAATNSGEFEQWITDRIDFTTGRPLAGDTGDMERWVTDRLDVEEYQAVAGLSMPILSTGGVHFVIFGSKVVR